MKKQNEIRFAITHDSSLPIVKIASKTEAYKVVAKPGYAMLDWYSADDNYQAPVRYNRSDKTQMLGCDEDYSAVLYTTKGQEFVISPDAEIHWGDIPSQKTVKAIIIWSPDDVEFWGDDVKIFVTHDENGLIDNCRLICTEGFLDSQPDAGETEIAFEDLYLPNDEWYTGAYRADIPGTWEYQQKMAQLATEEPQLNLWDSQDETAAETAQSEQDEIRHIITYDASVPITKIGSQSAAYQLAIKPGMGLVNWYSANDTYKENPVSYDPNDETLRLSCDPGHVAILHTKSGSIVCIDGLCKKDIPAQQDVTAILIEHLDAWKGKDVIQFWAKEDMRIFVDYDDNGLIRKYLFRYGDYPLGYRWDDEITFTDLYLFDSADKKSAYRVNTPGTLEYQKKVKQPAQKMCSLSSILENRAIDSITLDDTTSLIKEEIQFFKDTVAKVQRAIPVPIPVPIKILDHEQLSKKNKEALGICWSKRNETGEDVPFLITIDEFFVHECFFARDDPNKKLTEESLEEVIAHELAHLRYWRHGKKHTELKQLICRLIEEAEPVQTEEPVPESILTIEPTQAGETTPEAAQVDETTAESALKCQVVEELTSAYQAVAQAQPLDDSRPLFASVTPPAILVLARKWEPP